MFEMFKPEELLGYLKNFKNDIDRTGTTMVTINIKYLGTMLHKEALQ